jgi:KDO2-lipid IV(A) lauroyltransferase
VLLNGLAAANQNVVLVMGHLGNWEWGGNSFSLETQQQLYVIYHPLSNKYFDGLMYRMRSRFGTRLIAMKDTFREMVIHRKELNATAFIADQSPRPETAYWTTFLHQDTPVFWGTEKVAKKLQYPVVYIKIVKLKRGHYELSAEMLVEHPAAAGEGEILERFTRKLEQDIMDQPEAWLWSHRRWKHKRSGEVVKW